VQLAATWGDEAAVFERAEGDFGVVDAPPELSALRGRLVDNPLLQRWDQEIARRESIVELEDAQRTPDVVARAGVRRIGEIDENALVAGVSIPFPVFDRNQGARAAARSEVRRARYERRAAEVQLVAQLSGAYQDLMARYGELADLRGSILPGSQQAFEGVRRGFQQGVFRNLDVLDAQRRLFELRLREIEALRAYHEARARMEQLTDIGSFATPSRGGN